jgi:DNA topoisomerase III
MLMTSVTGHLMELDFAEPFARKWKACKPVELFELPVVKKVKPDNARLQQQLEAEARRCQWLVLWLDCDAEGENIAFEVIEVCRKANSRLRVLRARFSALIPREIFRCVNNLVQPDQNVAHAVDARQEVDLRLGAAFTRFQTMRLQGRFEGLQQSIISYGPCQFPTLGFIVERYKRIEGFQREPFWGITLEYSEGGNNAAGGAAAGAGAAAGDNNADIDDDDVDGERDYDEQQQQRRRQQQAQYAGRELCRATFAWERGRLYDHAVVTLLYEMCADAGTAVVTEVRARETSRMRPLPLSTVELQKRASR